jgi:hypothetical protein
MGEYEMNDTIFESDPTKNYVGSGEVVRYDEASEWQCQLFGGHGDGINWRPIKGREPNFFWRWMQYLFFGNRWIKK